MKQKILKLAKDLVFDNYVTLSKGTTPEIVQERSDLLIADSVLEKMADAVPDLPSPSFNLSVVRPKWMGDATYLEHLKIEEAVLNIQAESMRCAWLHCMQRLQIIESAIAEVCEKRRPAKHD